MGENKVPHEDEFIELMRKALHWSEKKNVAYMVNPIVQERMNACMEELRKSLASSGCKARIYVDAKPSMLTMASIRIEAKRITFADTESFHKALTYCDCAETTALINGKVRFEMGFYDYWKTAIRHPD